jgi:hypothetical protein
VERKLSDLFRKNIVVYDLEIKNSPDQIQGGWGNKADMGISVAVLWDYRSVRYRVFMDDNMDELVSRLNEPNTLIVAFNQKGFDNQVLRADKVLKRTGVRLLEDTDLVQFDMLEESRRASGLNSKAPGFKLDDHLKCCGLPCKTGDGALAPKMWQDGKVGTLVDYCLNDVSVEKRLFEYAYMQQRLICTGNTKGHDVKIDINKLLEVKSL